MNLCWSSAGALFPVCPRTGFMKDTKCTVATSFMSSSVTLYHVPFPVWVCLLQFPSLPGKVKIILWLCRWLPHTWYRRYGPLVPHIASWIILSSGFGCLPVLLALCHLLSWCHCSLSVKFSVYKSLCSVSIYLLFPIFFMTLIFFNLSYLGLNFSQDFSGISEDRNNFVKCIMLTYVANALRNDV